jgi:hypothetical protein
MNSFIKKLPLQIFLLSFILFFTSCAITYKKDSPENIKKAKAKALKDAEIARLKRINDEKNWQNQYYEQAIFKVENPIVVEDLKRLEAVCGGGEFEFKDSYQLTRPSLIKYKKYPINIKTNSGFSKKVFVTKGVCRELTLYKKQKGSGMRKSLKSINILYVYNIGSYILDVTFKSKFKGVEFFVK